MRRFAWHIVSGLTWIGFVIGAGWLCTVLARAVVRAVGLPIP